MYKLSQQAAVNWAIFLATFEIVTFARHFILKEPFAEITRWFGATPSQPHQCLYWTVLTILVIVRLYFAANATNQHVACTNAFVHLLEIPLWGYYVVVYNVPILLANGISNKNGAIDVFIPAVICVNAWLFYGWWKTAAGVVEYTGPKSASRAPSNKSNDDDEAESKATKRKTTTTTPKKRASSGGRRSSSKKK